MLFRKRSGGQLLLSQKTGIHHNPQGEPERLITHTRPTRESLSTTPTRTILAVEMPKFVRSLSYLRQN